MRIDQQKTYDWADESRNGSVTYSERSNIVIDESGLRKALGARVFNRYTTRVLDRSAMEKALEAGEVDQDVVSRFVTSGPVSPVLTVRERKENG